MVVQANDTAIEGAGLALSRLDELGVDEADLKSLRRHGIVGGQAGARLRAQVESLAEAGDLARVAVEELGVVGGGLEWPEVVEGE